MRLPTGEIYVPSTSSKDFLWTFPYDPVCNAEGPPVHTSWGRFISASSGSWNMTSWGRPNVTSWGNPHVQCATPGTSYTDVLRTSPADFMSTCHFGLICNSKGRVLPTSWGCPSQTSRGCPKNALKWFC